MSDYPATKAVQERVGCPHEWIPYTQLGNTKNRFRCRICNHEVWHHGYPPSASDCSTLWGALRAMRDAKALPISLNVELKLWALILTSALLEPDAAEVVNAMTLKALENAGSSHDR